MRGLTRARRGAVAESRALAWLRRQGLRRIAANVRCRYGEIDLVMQDGDTIVFVEVRYRRSPRPLSAVESIDEHKQRRLCRAASWYLAKDARFRDSPARFDVVAIDGDARDRDALQWIKDAFRPGA